MSATDSTVICPHCGARVPAGEQRCPVCGKPLPQGKRAWLRNLNAAEIFLLILGSIMLLIGLVAV
ncbi:zinc-ribbon domain-containing protein [Pontibacter sp. MBLB2868]|uniref:zinc-ribbon domain-containing protein n=1 Tax=Pontibacter sp. MBLB2868 TaxID=3451555 RepID=UPI003F74D8A4